MICLSITSIIYPIIWEVSTDHLCLYISYCGCNTLPQTHWLKTTLTFSFTVLRSAIWKQFHETKITVSADHFWRPGSKLFPCLFRRPLLFLSLSSSIFKTYNGASSLLSGHCLHPYISSFWLRYSCFLSSHKHVCNYIGPTRIFQDNFPISRHDHICTGPFTMLGKIFPVQVSINGHLWGPLLSLPRYIIWSSLVI